MARCIPYTKTKTEAHISIELDVSLSGISLDKHNKCQRYTQWDPNVELDCCDEIVIKQITHINEEINQLLQTK